MGKSIKAKIMLFSSMLLLAVLLCQVIFGVFLFKSYYTNLKKSQMETLFYELKSNYSDDLNVIRNITQQAENTYHINIQIFSDSELIYGNRGLGILPIEPGMGMLGRNRYSLEPKADIIKMPDMPEKLNLPNMPLINSENIILTGKFEYDDGWRYVRITTSVEAIEASVAALTKVNTFIAVLVLVIGIIGSYIFARRFSRPIQKIQEVARNVALLNFEARADENLSTSELLDLSVSINAMSNKLKSLISDLQASNEKLQADVDYQKRLDRMRREFVANVSHELKTPLHLLLMYSENLKNNIENIDKDYYCDTIIEETKRLNDMVKSLLDLSAIENGLTKMYMEELDLSDFAECTVSKMTVLFEGLSTNVGIEKGISVVGDGKYLEQAMKNFIVNAVSHTPVGGSISVELKQWDGKAVFSVFNEGSPIAEADIPQIWESFYKTDKARVRTDENHSGLGLYVVKTIIEAHGGEYGVRNAENGVEFWFSLPIEKNS